MNIKEIAKDGIEVNITDIGEVETFNDKEFKGIRCQ